MKKRYAIIACSLALCLGLSACGSGGNDSTSEKETSSTVESQPSVETTSIEEQPPLSTEPAPNNTESLQSTADLGVELVEEKRGHYDNGTFYDTDTTEDGSIRRIQSCYLNTIRENEAEDDYVRRRALGLAASIAPGTPYDVHIEYNEELSKGLGYPVYLAGYFTGSDQDARCWLIYLTRTEHYSYQYAFVSETEVGIAKEPEFIEYFKTLQLQPIAD